MDRLYVIVRADLAPGDQATQAAHALSAFAVEHEAAHRAWHTAGKNLILLASPDEPALRALYAAASDHTRAAFTEPDLRGALTAIALAGTARKLCSALPLALRAPRAA